jgi:hypothetical protein
VVTAEDAVANQMEDPLRLTDTQLLLLSAASQRDDRALEPPPNLSGGAAHKVVARLLTEGLVEQIRARGPLQAIRIEDAPTEAGAREPNEEPTAQRANQRKPGKSSSAPRKIADHDQAEPVRARADTKQASVIALLSRSQGTTIAAIMKAPTPALTPNMWSAHVQG